MRTLSLSLSFVLLAISSPAAVFSYGSGTLNDAIPDGNPTGLTRMIEVSGHDNQRVLDVNVVLNISGGANGDLYCYLSDGQGSIAVLLNRVGKTSANPFGYEDAGLVSVVLNDQAASDLHLYGGNLGAALAGSWQPDGRNQDPQSVTEAGSRTALLDLFSYHNPNATWTLFLGDLAGGEQATLVSWGLEMEIEPVPEPVNVALALFLLLAGGSCRWRRR